MSRPERVGITAAALAAVTFGASFPATAVVVRDLAPLTAAGIISTVALAFLALLVVLGVLPRPARGISSRPALVRLAIITLTGGLMFAVGMNVAVQLAGATVAGFVATLYAVFAAILAVPLLGERLTWTASGAFLLAVVGTALLADPGSLHGSLEGIGFALIAAVGFGSYLILARRWATVPGLGGSSMALAIVTGRGPLLLVIVALTDPGALTAPHLDLAAIVAMAYLAFVPGGISQVLILVSTRLVPARRTSAWLLLTPLTSAFLATTLLAESPTPRELLGGALVVTGILGASGAADGLLRTITRRRAQPT